MSDDVIEIIQDNSVVEVQTGLPGLSAYALAVANGFVGTIGEWLLSLAAGGITGLPAFSQTLVNSTNSAQARGTLELGTASTRTAGLGAGNVLLLDGSGKVDPSTLPAIAINDTFVVASQAEMLALTAQRGDIAIRSDLSKSFVLSTDSAATLADWKELLSPGAPVASVAGLAGVVSTPALKNALAITVSDVGTLQSLLDGKQASDGTLTAFAGLAGGADKLPYFTGVDALSQATFTAFARTVVDDPDAATMRSTIGALSKSGGDTGSGDYVFGTVSGQTTIGNITFAACTGNGAYSVFNASDGPLGADGCTWGIYSAFENSGTGTQLAICYFGPNRGKVYTRASLSSTFNAWVGLATLADLAAGGQNKGPWNASTNSPSLTTTAPAAGSNYTVAVVGTQLVTGSPTTFAVGDMLLSNGTSWTRIPAAIPSTGTTAGTLAAGDDGRFATLATGLAGKISAAGDQTVAANLVFGSVSGQATLSRTTFAACTGNGTYSVFNASDGPLGADGSTWAVYSAFENSGAGAQVAVCYFGSNRGKVYTRTLVSSSFSAWVATVTGADLASKLDTSGGTVTGFLQQVTSSFAVIEQTHTSAPAVAKAFGNFVDATGTRNEYIGGTGGIIAYLRATKYNALTGKVEDRFSSVLMLSERPLYNGSPLAILSEVVGQDGAFYAAAYGVSASSSDNTAALSAWIAAMNASPAGSVKGVLPPGVLPHSGSPSSIARSNVTIVGDGTTLRKTVSGLASITVNNGATVSDNVMIRGVIFDTTASRSASGPAVQYLNVSHARVEECFFINQQIGIYGGTYVRFYIDNCYFLDCQDAAQFNYGFDAFITHAFVAQSGSLTYRPGTRGFVLLETGGMYFAQSSVLLCEQGVALVPGLRADGVTAQGVNHTFFGANVVIDSCNYGVYAVPQNPSAFILLLKFQSGWCSSSRLQGMLLSSVDKVEITGTTFLQNCYEAVKMISCSRAEISSSNDFHGNCYLGPSSNRAAVRVEGTEDFRIVGNRFDNTNSPYLPASSNQNVGVSYDTVSQHGVITNNSFRSHATAIDPPSPTNPAQVFVVAPNFIF